MAAFIASRSLADCTGGQSWMDDGKGWEGVCEREREREREREFGVGSTACDKSGVNGVDAREVVGEAIGVIRDPLCHDVHA